MLLWCAVICGGAGVFFAFQVWDLRLTGDVDLFASVAAIVLLVLGGVALIALATLYAVARMLDDASQVETVLTDP
jgi:hypothetical protein